MVSPHNLESRYARAVERSLLRFSFGSFLLWSFVGEGAVLGTLGFLSPFIAVDGLVRADLAAAGLSLIGVGINNIGRRRDRKIIEKWKKENPPQDNEPFIGAIY